MAKDAATVRRGVKRKRVEQGQQCLGAKVQSAEDYARSLVESGRKVSVAHIEKALSKTKIPNQIRNNVVPLGATSIRGMVCGMYVYAERIGVTASTARYPWLSRLLANFCRQAHPDFAFTSIQVNQNYASRPHVDRNNLGKSQIIGLGDYSGGELWLHDDTGKKELPLDEDIGQERLYRKGTLWRGRLTNIRRRWFEFNGNKLHCTQPFQGQRYSLVYFTCDRYAEASPAVRAELRKAGFDFQWGSSALKRMLQAKRLERMKLRNLFEREAALGRKVGLHLVDGDEIRYEQENPKQPGCQAHKLYAKYLVARTIGEAKGLGARTIDFQYDFNWGYLQVLSLHPEPSKWTLEIGDPDWARLPVPRARGTVTVRVLELVDTQPGLEVPRAAMELLVARLTPGLAQRDWGSRDGPAAGLPLDAFRAMLYWAATGTLRCQHAHLPAVLAALKAWGLRRLAQELAPHMDA